MTQWYRLAFRDDDDERVAANRQTASLAAMALLLALVVAGLLLIRVLTQAATLQDCLMAGRHNCDSLLASQPRIWPW